MDSGNESTITLSHVKQSSSLGAVYATSRAPFCWVQLNFCSDRQEKLFDNHLRHIK